MSRQRSKTCYSTCLVDMRKIRRAFGFADIITSSSAPFTHDAAAIPAMALVINHHGHGPDRLRATS